jgi:hypothetical protein
VGFVACRAKGLPASSALILLFAYHPVADEDYIDDPRVGAMMGASAIRKAMQISLSMGCGMFHVHMHENAGIPNFSMIDVRESAKFVPDFFNVTPHMPHGAIVLSRDRATALTWRSKAAPAARVDEIASVGAPLLLSRRS